MPFLPVLPGHASFAAQVEMQIGYERFVFSFRALGTRGQFEYTTSMRAKFAAVLQMGVSAFYATGAMVDPHHCPLPGDLEEFLRSYIQNEMAVGIPVSEFTVAHKAANGDLAGLTVCYNHVQS